jgi:hypothetical protein
MESGRLPVSVGLPGPLLRTLSLSNVVSMPISSGIWPVTPTKSNVKLVYTPFVHWFPADDAHSHYGASVTQPLSAMEGSHVVGLFVE